MSSAHTTPTETWSTRRGPVVVEPGEQIGRYTVRAVLGAGGMGIVYEAYDASLSRVVALKLMRPQVRLDARIRNRFVREARALARLTHPNIVPIYDFGCDGDNLYIAMQRVEGKSLGQHVKTEDLDPTQVLSLLAQAGAGLVAAHNQGLVHRDFKPNNVLVDGDGRAYVCDFGLAIDAPGPSLADTLDSVSAPSGGGQGTPRNKTNEHENRTNQRGGTLPYMAPEQHEGVTADARADQFAFCVSAWEVLTGGRPFQGRDEFALLGAKLRGRTVDVTPSPRIRRILLRGLACDPKDRWPDLATLLGALARSHRFSRPLGWLAAGVVATAAAASMTRPAAVCPATTIPNAAASLHASADGVPGAIVRSLRRYAERDVEQVQSACEVWRTDPQVATPALDCITSEQRQFIAVTDALATTDDERLDRAASMARGLAKSRRCDPDRVLARGRESDVRETLVDARLAFVAGRIDDAEHQAKLARAEAARTGDSSLVARVDLLLLELLDERGIGPQQRAELMWSIAEGAYFSDDPDFAVVGQLGTLIWAACEQPDRVEPLASRAWEAVERTGPDPDNVVLWLAVRARVALCQGDLEGAIVTAQTGYDLARRLDDKQNTSIAVRELAMALATREPASAVPVLDGLVAASRAAYGPRHRRTAEDQLLAAEIGAAAGQRDLGTSARTALAIIGRTMAPDTAGWFDAVQRVARVEALTGDSDAAIERLTTLLHNDVAADVDALAQAVAQRTLADLLLAKPTTPERAAALLERALPVLVGSYGDPSPPVLQARYARAQALSQLGETTQAEAAARQLNVDAVAVFGQSPVLLRYAALHGETLLAADRHDEAVEVLRAAWALTSNVQAPHALAARLARGLSRSYLAMQSRGEARTWLQRARDYAVPGNASFAAGLDVVSDQLDAASSTTSTAQPGSSR